MKLQKSLLGAASLLSLSFGVAAHAQDTPPPPPPPGNTQGPPPQGGPGGPGGPGRRMEEMAKQLNLTPDQTTQLRAIMQEQRTKMEALRSDTSDTQRDRRKQMMAIHEEEVGKIHAILTPEQKTKYDAMQAEMRDQMRDRRRDGGGPPPPPPPPPPPSLE